MTVALHVRRAAPRDMPAVTELCALHADFEGAPFTPDGIASRLEKAIAMGCVQILVAEQDGVLAGYASVVLEFSTWQAAQYAHLDCLFVKEDFRKSGIGSQLFAEALVMARGFRVREIQWQTPAWNDHAVCFYRSQGAVGTKKIRFSLSLTA